MSTEHGCSLDQAEQTKMNDCYFDKKDWRICGKEVRTCRSNSLSCGDSNNPANEGSWKEFANMIFIWTDGSIQEVLEKAGERSKDRDEGRNSLTPPSRGFGLTGQAVSRWNACPCASKCI